MKVLIKNKRAWFDYEITDSLEVWIVLTWHEVKSLKQLKWHVNDAVVLIQNQELWIHNLDIPLYEFASHVTTWAYDAKWKRKLLINKKELWRRYAKINKTWQHIVPIELYLNPRNRIKVKIWLAKKKKKVQKRSALREKDTKRQMDREISKWR